MSEVPLYPRLHSGLQRVLVSPSHPGVELRANLESISHRCHPILVAFVWELTKETISLPLGCFQGGSLHSLCFSFWHDLIGWVVSPPARVGSITI